jgi:enterochelin esterase-like enzyme
MRRRSLLVLLLLAGCSAPLGSATALPTVTPHSTRPAPTLAPPAPIPSATPQTCLGEPGRVVTEEIIADGMARSLPYRVYLPPCYEQDNPSGYPVLILIHGLQSTDSQWDELGVNETADSLIQDGFLPPMVIVMPWERKGLDFEAAIADVLLPHIRATHAGDGDRRTTGIGGLSRGAGWAMRIGLQHPEEFGAIGLHSPAVLAPDLFYIADWVEAARPTSGLPRLWIDIAERDTSRAGARELAALLDDVGLTYAWSSAPGEHTAAYWSSRMADYLLWYGEPWRPQAAEATPSPQ